MESQAIRHESRSVEGKVLLDHSVVDMVVRRGGHLVHNMEARQLARPKVSGAHLLYKGDLFLTSRFYPLEDTGVLVKALLRLTDLFLINSEETRGEQIQILKRYEDHIRRTRASDFPIITSSIEETSLVTREELIDA